MRITVRFEDRSEQTLEVTAIYVQTIDPIKIAANTPYDIVLTDDDSEDVRLKM